MMKHDLLQRNRYAFRKRSDKGKETKKVFHKNSSLITSARNPLTDRDITCDELNKQNVTKHHAQARQVIYGDVLQLQLITPQVSKNQQVTR